MDKETTALEAVTLAGGFTDRAAPNGAKILRKGPDGAQDTIEIDLTDPKAREVHLTEGDTLLVPRGNTFFVSGEVRKPGAYQLEKSTTAFGAVTVGGRVHREGRPEPGQADPPIALGAGTDSGSGPFGVRPGRARLCLAGWRYAC